MKKAWRKNIAFLLVIAMMLTIMPMTVFAEGEEDGVEANAGTAMLYGSDGEVLESLSSAEEAQAVIAKWETKAQATTVYVSWNVGDNDKQEVEYTEDAYISSQNIVVTEEMGTVIATFSTENGTELAVASCNVVKAEEPERENVAQIGEMQYETLDKAIAAAEDGDTIELLADCTTEGLNINKNLTIDGLGNNITFNEYGIYTSQNKLIFMNCVMNMQVSNNPNKSGATANLISNADITFDNVKLNLSSDGENAGSGIYLYQESNLYIKNGSKINISGFNLSLNEDNSGIFADNSEYDGMPNRNIVIDNSVVSITDCGWHGMTINPIDLTVRNGSLLSLEKNGNGKYGGGLGCYSGKLIVENGSTVNADNNSGSSWGIFVEDLYVDGTSTLSACNNVGTGLTVGGEGIIQKGATVRLNENNNMGLWVYSGKDWYGDITIEDGADVEICYNKDGGIYNTNKLTMNAGKVMYNTTTASGGGIYNRSGAIATIAENVSLYNNHADKCGDDIYNVNGATITFGVTGEGWALDGEPDCTDDIDGWYDDSADNRWEAHDEQNNHIIKVATGTIETKKALKAAHGKNYEAGEINPVDWEKSKSKTATNLDANLESKVTLSLPSASYKGNLDVAFVLDGSTSADEKDLAAQAANLLDELSKIENLNVKASLTIFGGSQSILEDTGLLDISDTETLQELKAKLTDPSYDKMDGRSGSNLQAGVEAARTHLNNDKTVDSADKYMIILSDGAARMWYENGQAMSQTYLPDEKIFWNSNEDFIKRYNIEGVALRTFSEVWTAGQSGVAIDAYGMSEAEKDAATADNPKVASWNIVATDSDYYTTYEVATYYAATSIVKAADEANVILVSYPYHTGTNYGTYTESFKSWLAENKVVTRYDNTDMDETQIFSAVKDELIYLVDAGSKVVDVIGYDDTYNNGMGYHFDFLNDIAKLNLTVDGANLDAVQLSTNSNETVYGFGGEKASKDGKTYPYVLHYYPKGTSEEADEHFVWEINVPVKVNEPVQLTYSVKLTDPTSTAGTYTDLETNKIATLYPVDSNGNEGKTEEFEKPTVAYTVTGSTPEIPSGGGGDSYDGPYSDDPSVEIPDTDVPLTEPEVPPVVIEDPDVPLVDVPGEPVVEIEEPEVPLGDAPKTGDTAPMVAFAGLMAAAVVGLIITRRKFN